MDRNRSYAEGPEPRWYEGERGYGEPEWDPRGEQGGYGGYGEPESRFSDVDADARRADPGHGRGESWHASGDPGRSPVDAPTRMTPVGPRSAESPLDSFQTEPVDRGALRRAGPAAAVGDGVYRTRRPVLAIAFAVLTVIFELPALRLMASAAFADKVSGSGVISGIFLIIGLPVFAMGLYALVTSGRVTAQHGAGGWLRPPVGYLTVGLALFLAAALAAG